MPNVISSWSKNNTVVEYGSEKMWVKEVKDDGTNLATADKFGRFALVKESTFEGTAPETASADAKLVSEGGLEHPVVKAMTAARSSTVAGVSRRSWKFNGIIYAMEAEIIEFLDQSLGKYYAVVKERTGAKRPDNKTEYLVMPLCQFVGNISVKQTGSEQPFELKMLSAPDDIAITFGTATAETDALDDAAHDFGAAAATFNVPKGASYIIEVL